MRKPALFLPVLFLVAVAFAGCSKYGKVVKSKDYEYKLQMADEYFSKNKYKYSQQLYEELFPVFKGTQKFEELYYKYAYCFYYLKMYGEAENLFKGYLEVFPNSPKAEEVDFKRAYCFFKQSPKIELEQVNTMKAMAMMQIFINTHPGSLRNGEAMEIIDRCREKLEKKDYRAAILQYDLGNYRAAGLEFLRIIDDYPESIRGEEYKLMAIKSFFRFAKKSIPEKQIERYERAILEYEDFADRYPDGKLLKEAEEIKNQCNHQIKVILNEQTSSSAKL